MFFVDTYIFFLEEKFNEMSYFNRSNSKLFVSGIIGSTQAFLVALIETFLGLSMLDSPDDKGRYSRANVLSHIILNKSNHKIFNLANKGGSTFKNITPFGMLGVIAVYYFGISFYNEKKTRYSFGILELLHYYWNADAEWDIEKVFFWSQDIVNYFVLRLTSSKRCWEYGYQYLYNNEMRRQYYTLEDQNVYHFQYPIKYHHL